MKFFSLFNVSQLNQKYVYNFFSVAGGTLIAQLITFLASPALSRLYSPAAFGHFSTYSATISILAVISCARYELAIPLPKDIEDSVNIFKTAFWVAIIIAIIILPIVLMLYLINKSSTTYLFYPSVVLLNCLGLCLNLLHNRLNNFKHSSFSKILQSISVTIVAISISNASESYGLIISSYVGQFLNFLYLIYFLPKHIKHLIYNKSFDKKIFFSILRKYKQFPAVSLLPAFLNIFSSQIPNYLINSVHGAIFAGYYFFSLRLVVLPVSLIGSSINEIFFQKIIEKKNNNEQLHGFMRNNLFFLLLMAFIFLLFFYFFSETLIPVLFGSHWEFAASVCKILSISMFIKLVVSPLTMSFIALDKVNMSANWQYSYFFGVLVLGLILNTLKVGFLKFLLILVSFDFIAYSIALVFIFRCVKNHDKKLELCQA